MRLTNFAIYIICYSTITGKDVNLQVLKKYRFYMPSEMEQKIYSRLMMNFAAPNSSDLFVFLALKHFHPPFSSLFLLHEAIK